MAWFHWLLFAIDMLIKYGPTLWKIGKEIYDVIEKRGNQAQLTSDQKAGSWNDNVKGHWTDQRGKHPKRAELNRMRERVWMANNPGKKPKKLHDPRLKIGTAGLRIMA